MQCPGSLTLRYIDAVAIFQAAEWAFGPVWTGMERLLSPRFETQDVKSVASRYTPLQFF